MSVFRLSPLRLYQLVQVADPRLWETANFGAEMTAATALTELLRMFEIPLCGIAENLPKAVLYSYRS
jgi:hypothetical protein